MKYTCPCCGYKTLDEEPPGTYDICSIFFWEDDGVQYDDPDYGLIKIKADISQL